MLGTSAMYSFQCLLMNWNLHAGKGRKLNSFESKSFIITKLSSGAAATVAILQLQHPFEAIQNVKFLFISSRPRSSHFHHYLWR